MSGGTIVLSRLILNNLPKNSIGNFLEERGLYKEWVKIRKNKVDYSDFIANKVIDGLITTTELSRFLFDNLFYGIHKNNFTSYIQYIDFSDEKVILNRIKERYKRDTNFINIIGNTLREDIDKLTALKIEKDESKISSIKMLFGKIIKINTANGVEQAYSYIPVEIDFQKMRLTIRVAPKMNLENDVYKPTYLMEKTKEDVTRLFGLKFKTIDDEIYKTIYKISKTLIDEVYQKMHNNVLDDDEEEVSRIALSVKELLGSNGLDINESMIREYGIFNLFKNVKSLMNNAIVLEKILDSSFSITQLDLDGYLSYLKYQDKDEYNITLKSDTSETISFSETFLRIKSDLDEFRYVSAIKVAWNLTDSSRVDLKYRFHDESTLNIRFYNDTNEGEFLYVIEKYEKFRQKDIRIISRVDKSNVDDEDNES